jgi:RNA polymerase sigma factor (sigma-70 family)
VCHHDYFHAEYGSFFVSESSSLKGCELGRRQCEWTDEEIAAIRIVLQRLTASRVMNVNDAEDLVQDTLLTMIAKHPEIELEKGPLVWSMGILRKKVGNYYRKVQRFASWSTEQSCARQCAQQSTLTYSPEVKVFHEELQGIVDETLEQLPWSQRQAMELLIAGHDPGEIVKQLRPERYQNVINRLHRGRLKLAKELAKHGYGPLAKAGLRKNMLSRPRLKHAANRERRMVK